MGFFELVLLIELVLVLALSFLLTAILRRPRLGVEASLRGGTADGTLYVVVTHKKGWAARRVRVDVSWRKRGASSRSATRELGTTRAGDALRLEIDELQRLLPAGDPAGWERLDVRVRAWNALPRRSTLSLAQRDPADARGGAAGARRPPPVPEPVRYARARELPCPERPDGRHDYEERPYENDGVTERWRVCRACRHVQREPLTPEQEERQRRVRSARAERLRRQMEDEFARMDAEQQASERARQARERERQRARPPTDDDGMPIEVAFFVLELDAAKASWADAQAAHRKLALLHHPDRHAGAPSDVRAAAERKMQEINAVRDRLRDHFEP